METRKFGPLRAAVHSLKRLTFVHHRNVMEHSLEEASRDGGEVVKMRCKRVGSERSQGLIGKRNQLVRSITVGNLHVPPIGAPHSPSNHTNPRQIAPGAHPPFRSMVRTRTQIWAPGGRPVISARPPWENAVLPPARYLVRISRPHLYLSRRGGGWDGRGPESSPTDSYDAAGGAYLRDAFMSAGARSLRRLAAGMQDFTTICRFFCSPSSTV